MTLKFNPNYKEWKSQYDTELVYTRKDMNDALAEQAKAFVVNRVIQSFTGRMGDARAMQILAVHQTSEGIMVIVK